ncbi:MAG: hypothetical protein GQ574_16140 [Crocinitomix sp.]|nr:hypothetical protein [Crocinitomix sp.]
MKNFKSLSKKQMYSVKGGEPVGPGETYMGGGYDAGGHYIIVDTGTACVKRYQPCAFEH